MTTSLTPVPVQPFLRALNPTERADGSHELSIPQAARALTANEVADIKDALKSALLGTSSTFEKINLGKALLPDGALDSYLSTQLDNAPTCSFIASLIDRDPQGAVTDITQALAKDFLAQQHAGRIDTVPTSSLLNLPPACTQAQMLTRQCKAQSPTASRPDYKAIDASLHELMSMRGPQLDIHFGDRMTAGIRSLLPAERGAVAVSFALNASGHPIEPQPGKTWTAPNGRHHLHRPDDLKQHLDSTLGPPEVSAPKPPGVKGVVFLENPGGTGQVAFFDGQRCLPARCDWSTADTMSFWPLSSKSVDRP